MKCLVRYCENKAPYKVYAGGEIIGRLCKTHAISFAEFLDATSSTYFVYECSYCKKEFESRRKRHFCHFCKRYEITLKKVEVRDDED